MLKELGQSLFGTGEAPEYGGRVDVEPIKEAIAAQDEASKEVERPLGGPKDIQMPEAQTFTQKIIQDRARQRFGDFRADQEAMARLRQREELQAMRMQNMDYVSRAQRLVKHVQQRRRVAYANQAAARNRVVGSIIGTAGATGGAFLRGPMGAYAGSQLGAAAGNQRMMMGPQLGQTSPGFEPQMTFGNSNAMNGSDLGDVEGGF